MASRSPDDKKESIWYAAGAGLAAVLTLGALIWLTASHRIVWGSLAPGLWLGAMWKWGGTELGIGQWNYIVQTVQKFAYKPNAVSFVSWAEFMTVVLRPIALIAMLAYIAFVLWLGTTKRNYMRRFTADQLLLTNMRKFTGTAPVLAIRMKVAKGEHPLWRTQVAPEEVFLKYRVPVTDAAPQVAAAGAPMVQQNNFDNAVARNYFIGPRGQLAAGRLDTIMLGRQVVNVPTDGHKAGTFCFTDRMSHEGKVLAALWAAVAFGAEAGREEYCKYRDLLNLSAFGTSDGMANLKLAEPLYLKYRAHPKLAKLFAVHHWEHTALFQLLAMAQRKGRFTTAEVLWLRPTNRVMFFALNSRGSGTPHTEAAATFAMHTYERMCAQMGRLPLFFDEDKVLRHVIYVEKAVDGLRLEWERWVDALDEDDDGWWLDEDIWKRTNQAVNAAYEQAKSAVPTSDMPGADDDTPFDRLMTEQAAEKAKKAEAAAQVRATTASDMSKDDLDALMKF